jgi:Disintegrin
MRILGSRNVLFGVAFVFVIAGYASAAITAATSTAAGSTCNQGNDANGFCGSSASLLINDGTILQSKFVWNMNADVDPVGLGDRIGNSQHSISFNVTAPSTYRLDITTQRVGDLNRRADDASCVGSVSMGAVTVTSNVPVNTGALTLPAPTAIPNANGTTTVTFSQNSSGSIVGTSNGVAQGHSLTFTWSNSAHSNSCEAAVRGGLQNGTTISCPACGYPGSPSRVQTDDGHVVTITLIANCGNGTIDPGEDCDLGAGVNGAATSCCTAGCTLRAAGQVCRSASAVCDLAEACDGASPTCPADAFASSSTSCRPAAGACDVADNCPGDGPDCTVDVRAPAGTSCRAASDVCDRAETCDGVQAACPADGFEPVGTVCRAAAGDCDLAEVCTGTGPACPAIDAKSTGVCRPAADACDAAENCDGLSNDCPPDGFEAASVVCRSVAGPCDVAENCTGSGPACPPDGWQPNTTPCRPPAGPCDLAETCSGAGPACPPDLKSTASCRAAAGPCDVAESCDGVGDQCPPDAKSTAVCRPAIQPCDVAEACDGVSDTCPADGLAPATTPCRPAAGPCDVAENCTGSSPLCPGDVFASASQVCRPAAPQCDVAEHCTGLGVTCPADAFAPDGTGCSDGTPCTVQDQCTGGVCGGTPDPDCLDDFDCFKAATAKGTAKFGSRSLALADRFENETVEVVKPRLLCAPSDSGQDIIDPAIHLEVYRIKQAVPHVRRTNILVTNALGQLHVDTIKPEFLLVPTAKDPLSPPAEPNPTNNVDHFKCYHVRTTPGTERLPRGLTVSLSDQFITSLVELKGPRHLCTPVDKAGEGIKNPANHLLCYKSKSVIRPGKQTFFTRNQFGPEQLTVIKHGEYCVPSTATP